ncbi:MAG: squalene/phytoene synthase family protein [Acidimicrobiia bacterium]|nr:squalene/phytoene synthase family protein [Acidimicrobiia bacterium]
MTIPFALRRPWLIARGAGTDRNRPDLAHLGTLDDPEAFVWAILPHAARTFATSIIMLPAPLARTAAVAYLYCRMLDTYEDLSRPDDRDNALQAFAARMSTFDAPPPLPADTAQTDRDRGHLLLVNRCSMVDRVFVTLPESDQTRIIDLVRAMADGMVWSSQRFAQQGGVLVDAHQVSRYCHHVIGGPILFTLLLVLDVDLTVEQHADALASSELIQLANITRDIERDLARGIAYHPSLLPHLGRSDVTGATREARRDLMAQALPHASAYTRLAHQLATRRFSFARASAVLMLLFTDRHYQSSARLIGIPGWKSRSRTSTIVLWAILSAWSRRWAFRVMRRVEHNFLTAADAISREATHKRAPDGTL